MSATYNLVVDQATTFNLQFQVKTDNVVWDLTNYTATMTVRPFLGSASTTILATTGNGLIALDAANGRATVTLNSTITNIKAQSYVYDFVLNSGSETTRILEGQFIVVAGVTV